MLETVASQLADNLDTNNIFIVVLVVLAIIALLIWIIRR